MQRVQVWSLVRELRSHMPQSQKSRAENKRSNTVINSIKTLKMVHMKKKKKEFQKNLWARDSAGHRTCIITSVLQQPNSWAPNSNSLITGPLLQMKDGDKVNLGHLHLHSSHLWPSSRGAPYHCAIKLVIHGDQLDQSLVNGCWLTWVKISMGSEICPTHFFFFLAFC